MCVWTLPPNMVGFDYKSLISDYTKLLQLSANILELTNKIGNHTKFGIELVSEYVRHMWLWT